MPTFFRVEYIIAGVLLAAALLAYAFRRELGVKFFRVFAFAAAALIGQFVAPLCFVLAVRLHLMPNIAEANPLFHRMSVATTMLPWAIWAFGVLIALGYFIARRREVKIWCLFAPIYLPAIYMLLAFLYFNNVPGA